MAESQGTNTPPDPPKEIPDPTLLHTLHQQDHSVLSVAADDKYIFSGSQSDEIYVWDRRSFTVKTTLQGHTGSVLALELDRQRHWLFSSSEDSTVRVWSTKTLTPLYVLHPYLEQDSGDLFSLAYAPSLQTLYIGCQNTSLQWFEFKNSKLSRPKLSDLSMSGLVTSLELSPSNTPPDEHNPKRLTRKKFFEGGAQIEALKDPEALQSGQATPSRNAGTETPPPYKTLEITAQNVIDSAHYGYLYSMAILPSTHEGSDDGFYQSQDESYLVTGSGDETVKLWRCKTARPQLMHTFEGTDGAVLSLVARHETIYAGCQDGHVKVWDIQTKTLIRTIIAQEGVDILSLSILDTDLYISSANGTLQRWSASFANTGSWRGHNGIVLSSFIAKRLESDDHLLITGSSDNTIKLWEIERPKARLLVDDPDDYVSSSGRRSTNDTLLHILAKFVSIPSVSSNPTNQEDCRQAAIWLRKCLTQLGADATLLPTHEGVNPLVLGTFQGSHSVQSRPRILFYGHYDVIAAPSEGWYSDPFTLTGRSGYLYGRGTTDNKGPILAAACAASELLRRRSLGCDIVFLIEGEEEAGSMGFRDAIKLHKDLIGPIDAILVSNSTWITEDHPCITYGLRGVVHSSIEISSDRPDLHSGIEGGAVVEPMVDMIALLSKLSEGHKVLIPGFYDQVRSPSPEEQKIYEQLSKLTDRSAESWSSRWSEPSLSIHSLEISGPGNATVIPSRVRAKVSLRIVPDQSLEVISRSLRDHVMSSFKRLQSPNELSINIDHTADWWLGNFNDPYFEAMEDAIKEEWGVAPLRIREGGSIPSIPDLEKEFGCSAIHLPLGQSLDQAHLPNERISVKNLRNGKAVIERFLLSVSENAAKFTRRQ